MDRIVMVIYWDIFCVADNNILPHPTQLLELEEQMFKVKLNVIDTPGFGDYVNNYDSWLPVVEFIDDQHENYMRQEQQPSRQGVIDMRVHACLYFIRPNGHG